LKALGGGIGKRLGDGVAVLAIQVGQEPGNVALQGVATLGAAEQRGERLHELGYLGQGLG